MQQAATECELSIVMPCLDEAETLATCIRKAKGFLSRAGVEGEVVIADNGSVDGSQEIARAEGARVVDVSEKGYGAALRGGIQAAAGRFVIMGDADDSYDFARLDEFVAQLRAGHQLVMGNRFLGGIATGAMPPLHRYLGNPVLTGIGRLLFRSRSGDFHCGLRGFDREAILDLGLQTTGMEFASEMVVKATLHGLRVTEVPTTLSKDGRSRPPHLRSWRDGWRHLRFLLLFSPRWLYLYPGAFLILTGLLLMTAIWPGPLVLAGVRLDVHSMVGAGGMTVIGTQLLTFGLLAKKYGIRHGLFPDDGRVRAALGLLQLERAVIAGGLLFALGLAGLLAAVVTWGATGFGDLDYRETMRAVLPAVTGMAVGVQLAASGFMSSLLELEVRE